jgi:Tn3 transposase DDE domain/Phage integrase family
MILNGRALIGSVPSARAGVRIGEAISLRVNDVEGRNRSPRLLVYGKGGRRRVVPVGPEVIEAVDAYLISRRDRLASFQATDELFVRADGRPFTRGTLDYSGGGVGRATPESRRSTCSSSSKLHLPSSHPRPAQPPGSPSPPGQAALHGHRGQLRQGYREGQEGQLGALGLVLNILVLWTTRYLKAALDQLDRAGHSIHTNDVERLSPLKFRNVNLHGRYSFVLSEEVARDALRPLRDGRELDEDDVEEA